VAGINPAVFFRLYNVDWKEGSARSAAGMGPGGVIVLSSFAKSHHLHLGSRLALVTATGAHLDLAVAGVVGDKAYILGSLNVLRPVLQRSFGQANDWSDFVSYAPGASPGHVRGEIDHVLASQYPQAQSYTSQQFEQQQVSSVSSLINFVYVMLALAVVVSLLGLVNTLVLSIYERRRELGLLRAVGTTRRQVRQMVRYESVITSLIGAVIGVVVGAVAAYSTAHWLVGGDFVPAFPAGTLLVVFVLAGLAGVVAALGPARRASRLDILTAIAAE
jgi:putative ABC transport system permease protein